MNFNYIGDNPNFFNWGRQGWVCPKCGRVYSPDTPICFYCNNNTTTTTTTTTALNGPYIHKVEDPLKEPQITLEPKTISERMFYVDLDSLPYY